VTDFYDVDSPDINVANSDIKNAFEAYVNNMKVLSEPWIEFDQNTQGHNLGPDMAEEFIGEIFKLYCEGKMIKHACEYGYSDYSMKYLNEDHLEKITMQDTILGLPLA